MATELVHPDLRSFVSANPTGTLTADRLPLARNSPAFNPLPASDVTGVRVEERHLPGIDGPEVRVLIYRPVAASSGRPGVVHMHGGGFVAGKPEMEDGFNRRLAAALDGVVVSVDYRLAPEHRYPAALDDCTAALRWLHTQADGLGVDRRKLAVKGESAGGGLAAAVSLRARDRGDVAVAFQCLTYPMLDDRQPADPHPHTGKFVWTAPSNQFGWGCYLGTAPGGPDVPPTAAPARAERLHGLPPTLIVTASLDLFLEENLEFARRLTRAGVPVELLVYPGVVHGFQLAGSRTLNERYDRDVLAAFGAALGQAR